MKILRIAAGIMLAVCAGVTAFIPHAKSPNVFEPKAYKGIITLWQIDGFEGGTGSRKSFLLKAAREFERQNQGVLISVTSPTAQSAKEQMLSGIVPDLTSYCVGALYTGASRLITEHAAIGGRVENAVYALPWCRGGYCIITQTPLSESNEIQNLIVSQGEFTQPMIALALSKHRAKNLKVLPPKEAFSAYRTGKDCALLGTQRDVVRLINLQQNFYVCPLTGFNDLYQYISVTGKDELKNNYAEKFIDYLLSSKVQKTLTSLSLFSAQEKVVYEDERLNLMSGATAEKTISAFISREQIANMQELALAAYNKGQTLPQEIKNFML